MAKFYVYRHGFNGANNPAMDGGPETVKVATVEADDSRHACDLAANRVTVYNNQHLCAGLAEDVDVEEEAIDTDVELV